MPSLPKPRPSTPPARPVAAARRRQAALQRRQALLAHRRAVAAERKAAAAARAKVKRAPASGSPATPASTVVPVPEQGAAAASPGSLSATSRPFTRADAERLLWRAGFGPRPGDVERAVALGREAAVDALVYPSGAASLVGPEPHDSDGNPLAPEDLWGQDTTWWLDRMVRSDQPLVERMTLVWHDWFATSREKVGSAARMLRQNELFRRHALGSFAELLRDITVDPAMLIFLDGVENTVRSPNENYAREVMELFTLGAGRGAYTEQDVRELARAFTGWRTDWVEGVGFTNFRYVPSRHDNGSKTVFGHTGAWGVDDGLRLCLEHPLHASYFVTKLWSAFIPTPPGAETVAALSAIYVSSGHQIAPVLAAILKHPDLYDGPRLVKPPAVYAAGLLRATGRYIETDSWAWLLAQAGQQLFFPPNVSGWDETRWLDTNTWRGRWSVAGHVLQQVQIDPWSTTSPYSTTETPEQAVAAALAAVGDPSVTSEVRAVLLQTATTMVSPTLRSWERGPYRARRQNALRLLIATCSDHQTS